MLCLSRFNQLLCLRMLFLDTDLLTTWMMNDSGKSKDDYQWLFPVSPLCPTYAQKQLEFHESNSEVIPRGWSLSQIMYKIAIFTRPKIAILCTGTLEMAIFYLETKNDDFKISENCVQDFWEWSAPRIIRTSYYIWETTHINIKTSTLPLNPSN